MPTPPTDQPTPLLDLPAHWRTAAKDLRRNCKAWAKTQRDDAYSQAEIYELCAQQLDGALRAEQSDRLADLMISALARDLFLAESRNITPDRPADWDSWSPERQDDHLTAAATARYVAACAHGERVVNAYHDALPTFGGPR